MGRYSSIFQAFIDRVKGHTAKTQMLAGWKFAEGAPLQTEVEGVKDLPSARLLLPDMPEKAHDQLSIVSGTMTLKFVVSTVRAEGTVKHLEAVEKFCDALDKDGADLDLLLGALLSKPFQISIHDPWAVEGGFSLNSHVTVTVTPLETLRGQRSA